jgi:hypothetical protein
MLKCEICGNTQLKNVVNLGEQPLCDDLLPLNSDKICINYPISILWCNKCYTCHQEFNVPKNLLFTKNYHYRARMTGSVLAGMKDLVNEYLYIYGSLVNKFVLDIGCNDGSLLNFFKEEGAATLGVEPTNAYQEVNHNVINKFFDSSTAYEILQKYGKLDIITFTNVFAHIENLPELIKALKIIMHDDTVIIIENHYLGAIIKFDQFDTFYHEHPRTYSLKSFKYISKLLDVKINKYSLVSRYGGNIRVFLSKNEMNIENQILNEDTFYKSLVLMNKNIQNWVSETKELIENHVRLNGKLNAKAFPGRASILIKLLKLDEQYIKAVYEIKGSIKVFHYVPGTKIPILPEKMLYDSDEIKKPILNLAWHIPKEVELNLRNNGFTGEIINIKEFI